MAEVFRLYALRLHTLAHPRVTSRPWFGDLALVLFLVTQASDGVLTYIGVSAVTVIVALLIGGNLLGIPGAILAVPTVAILQVLFTEWVNTREEKKE